MDSFFTYSVDSDHIAWIVFDTPGAKVNAISIHVLEQLDQILDKIVQDKSIKAVVIKSGKPDVFIAGADLHSFEPMFDNPALAAQMIDTGHRIFNKLANLGIPSFAMIQGACLGGGMELALACTYRIASDHPKTLLGLPEVTLGIIPGWGGTQRLPRLVGLMEALPMLLTGRGINAIKASKIKLVDAVFSPPFFETKSKEFVLNCLKDIKPVLAKRKRKWTSTLMEGNPFGRGYMYDRARKDVMSKTKGHYPAPLVLIDLLGETYTLPLEQGLQKEADTFKSKLGTTFVNAKNLIKLFFIQEKLKKDAGMPLDVKPRKVNSAAVVGAGIMGSGIAWLFSNQEISTRMKDIDWSAVGKGMGNAYGIYKKRLTEKKIKPCDLSLKFHSLSGTTDYSGFADRDLIVEAAVENLDLKHKILAELEAVVSPKAIIGTNTSSLTLAEMSKGMKNPERLVGMHFFNPPHKMPLVEVVTRKNTDKEAVATAVDVCRKLGKTPIVVGDCAGFLVNRVTIPGLCEIIRMYEEGASFESLENMMLNFGMPMGIFELCDEVGIDVLYHVCNSFQKAYGDRMDTPKLIAAMYDKKLLGKKTGKGFYIHDGKERRFNEEVETLRKGLATGSRTITEEEMRNRTFLTMINEASRCLDEKIVAGPEYVDMATIMGTGFPPFRGGLLSYADTIGPNTIVETLKRYAQSYGKRFTPSPKLLTMQQQNKGFYN